MKNSFNLSILLISLFILSSCENNLIQSFEKTFLRKGAVKAIPSGFVVDDFNRDGNPDIIISEVRPSKLKLFYTSSGESNSFNDPIIIDKELDGLTPLRDEPRLLASQDINLDDAPDLFRVNYFEHEVRVMLNDGLGNFPTETVIDVGRNPVDIRIASIDNNNDAIMDFFVLSQYSKTVEVFIGDNTGNFSSAGSFPVGFLPQTIETADLDNDGFLDFMVPNYSDREVSVYMGDGNGGFVPHPIAPLISINDRPIDLKIADFDKDGFMDFAVLEPENNLFSIFIGVGDGTFNFLSTQSTLSKPKKLYIDNSKFLDNTFINLAVTYLDRERATFFQGVGDGNFLIFGAFESYSNITNLIIEDMNLDGEADVLLFHPQAFSTSIIPGSGLGLNLFPNNSVKRRF